MAGVFATFEEGEAFSGATEPKRVVAAGLDVRPLFYLRWLRGMETDLARWDLFVDSLGVELGPALVQTENADIAALQVGLTAAVPLFASAQGLWLDLSGGLRWSQRAMATAAVIDVADRSAYLSATLSWHQIVLAHVVDWGDRAPE